MPRQLPDSLSPRAFAFLVATSCLLAWTVAWRPLAAQPAPRRERPLTAAEIVELVTNSVSSLDILMEAARRGVSDVIDEPAVNALMASGADRILLNQISSHSLPLQPQLRDLLAFGKEERFARAVEVADELIRRSPRLLPAYVARAQSQLSLGEASAAVDDAQKLLQFAPSRSDYRLLLAQAFAARDEPRAAIQELTRIVARQSPSAFALRAECYFQRGRLLVLQRDYLAAAEDFQRALVHAPTSLTVLSAAVELFARAPDAAVRSPAAARELAAVMQMLASNDTERVEALLRQAEALAACEQFDNALAALAAAKAIPSRGAWPSKIETLRAECSQRHLATWSKDSSVEESAPTRPEPLARLRSELVRISPEANETSAAAFWLSSREVTRQLWASVMDQPSAADPDLPKDRVSWPDVQQFIERLNQRAAGSGVRYRLPTSQEWEFAFRATRPTGETVSAAGQLESGGAASAEDGWTRENSSRRLHPVASARAAPGGLYDLIGNVAEWCQDSYPLESGATSGSPFRVVRGGSYATPRAECTAAQVGCAPSLARWQGLGLRLAADEELPATSPPVKGNPPVERLHANDWGLARSLRLARQTSIWEPIASAEFSRNRVINLGLNKVAVAAEAADWEAAIAGTRELIRESEIVEPRRADFAGYYLALLMAQQDEQKRSPNVWTELLQAVDVIRTRNDLSYWYAEYARAVVYAMKQDWSEAQRSATRAIDLGPAARKREGRRLLEAIQKRDASLKLDLPTLPDMLGDSYLPPTP